MIEQDRGLDLDVEFVGQIAEDAEQRQGVDADSIEGHVGVDGGGLDAEVPGDPFANPRGDLGAVHARHFECSSSAPEDPSRIRSQRFRSRTDTGAEGRITIPSIGSISSGDSNPI